MRICFLVVTSLFLVTSFSEVKAQAYVRTSYFHDVGYEDKNGVNSGDGSIIATRGGVVIPLSVKIEEKKLADMWNLTMTFNHAKFNEPLNKIPFNELLTVQMGISHIRSLSEKWSLLASLRGGVSYDDTKLSSLRWDNVIMHGIGIAIYKVNTNLKLGAGVILTNNFSTPMLFPTFYAKWSSNSKYSIEFTKLISLYFAAGVRLNNVVKLNWIVESNRIGTPTDIGGENMYLSYKYYATGFHPEFNITKNLTIPLTIGYSANGSATYKKRELKSFLDDKEKYRLSPSPYVSIGIKYSIYGNKKK